MEEMVTNTTDSVGRHVILFTGRNGSPVFSRQFLSAIHYRGYRFNSLDQYYYGRMALFFKAYAVFKSIMAAAPDQYALLARNMPKFDTELWHQNSEEIMLSGIREKFRQNRDARQRLLLTGSARLIHVNPIDGRWGNGLNERDSLATDPNAHPGENKLGELYMQVRNELKNA